MNIHGNDVIFGTDMDLEETKVIVMDYLQTRFPDGVIDEDDDNSFFFYINAAAQESWDDLGWDPSNDDKMWHFLFYPPEVTVVVGDAYGKDAQDAIVDIQELLAY